MQQPLRGLLEDFVRRVRFGVVVAPSAPLPEGVDIGKYSFDDMYICSVMQP